ncbi:MAG: hypothetical protein MJ156_01930 [Alphaproteobacteria bacterium]|nr:hypothetical protein [Alphaproteobacteria bacterium]
MFGKIKKVFFTGIFGVLYISYIAQFVYVLAYMHDLEKQVIALALLAVEWLALISARYLSKKSSNNAQQHMNNFGRRH